MIPKIQKNPKKSRRSRKPRGEYLYAYEYLVLVASMTKKQNSRDIRKKAKKTIFLPGKLCAPCLPKMAHVAFQYKME